MKQRPIGTLVNALKENGCDIKYIENEGCLPLAITPSSIGFPGGHVSLSASLSSQYVSSILMCAPYANKHVTLQSTGGQVISQQYVDMTAAMMKSFGIETQRSDDNVYKNPKRQLS